MEPETASAFEVGIFRVFNDASDVLYAVVWPLMQYGEPRGVPPGQQGYHSGHAAVSAALAFILFANLLGRRRWLPTFIGGVRLAARCERDRTTPAIGGSP